MRKVKVLYLLPSLLTGGLERMVHLLATNLDRELFAPQVQIFDHLGPYAEKTEAAGIPVRFDPRSGGFLDLRFVRTLVARLKDDPPDLIHAHNVTSLVYGTIAARLAGNIPIVYTEHDRAFDGPIHDRALHLMAGRMVDRFCVVADWIRRTLVEQERLPGSRIQVVPNGIEASRFSVEVDVSAVRRELSIPEGAPLAGCVARLVPVKNHAGLLTAWRRIVDVWPDATLLLVGAAPAGESGDDVKRIAARLRLERNVRFLGDRDDVPRLFKAMDFHVLASHSEGMSLTLIEAMASGRASVATDVGGNPEVLEDGRTGLLVAHDDQSVHRLATAMASLIQDPHAAERMGRAARAVFERRFTLDAMVDTYARIYLECLAARRTEGPTVAPAEAGMPS